MPGTAAPASQYKRAAIALAGLLCLGGGLWALLSTRSPARRIDGDFTCEELELPVAARLNLNYAQTQLRSARLWGFDGTISNVGRSVSAAGKHEVPGGALNFQAAQAEPAAFVQLVPDGAFGLMSIDTGAGVLLKPTDMREGSGCVQLLVRGAATSFLHMRSDSVQLRAARYHLAQAGIEQDVPSTLTSRSPAEPLESEFRSASKTGPAQAELCFQKVNKEITLVDPGKTGPIDVGDELKCGGVLNPSIKLEGYRDLPGRTTDRKTDLVINGSGLRVTGLFLSAGDHGRSTMRLTVAGEARSIQQGGREILPSWLEDISEEWWTRRGIWLVLAGLVLVIFRKLIDRALDVLLKKLLPE